MIKVRVEKLIRARLRAGYTQRGLARKLGLSSGYFSQLESGSRRPRPAIAKRVSDVLDADFEELFEIQTSESLDIGRKTA